MSLIYSLSRQRTRPHPPLAGDGDKLIMLNTYGRLLLEASGGKIRGGKRGLLHPQNPSGPCGLLIKAHSLAPLRHVCILASRSHLLEVFFKNGRALYSVDVNKGEDRSSLRFPCLRLFVSSRRVQLMMTMMEG